MCICTYIRMSVGQSCRDRKIYCTYVCVLLCMHVFLCENEYDMQLNHNLGDVKEGNTKLICMNVGSTRDWDIRTYNY